ncbi:MAG: hypothetical protein WAZ77_21215 [Candidatus Nitrosopolaris sp.]|jgi:arginase family enzyme
MSKRKKDPMVTIIGVPTNSSGKIDGVARGPSALRKAGLIDVLSSYCVSPRDHWFIDLCCSDSC